MSNKEVTFHIRIETEGGQLVKDVTVNTRELGNAAEVTAKAVGGLNGRLLDINQAAQSVQNAFSGFAAAAAEVKKLTEAFTVQEMAEVKLETVMKQRMSATEADIDTIRRLASAQQELGVISDEVQLSGAQQLATFIDNRQSLEQLIPAMNNLLAQQRGLNASEQDAVSIGNLLGKAMQGQTTVLQRVGVTFTAAQAKILQYGDEQQRAATLAQVITDNVGQMNARLGETDAGRAKQLANAIGDIKEQLGSFFTAAEPALTAVSELGMASFGVINLANGIRGIAAAFSLSKIAALASAVSLRVNAVATGLLSTMNVSATTSTWALRAATIGLYAVMSGGLYLAVQALIALWQKFTEATDEGIDTEERAKAAAEDARMAQEQEAAQMRQTRTALELNIQKLKEFRGSKEKEREIVEEMNNTYGSTIGYFTTVSQWYKALTADSAAYCDQMIAEARTRSLANQIAQKEQENHDLLYDNNGKKRRYSKKRETEEIQTGQYAVAGTVVTTTQTHEIAGSSELEKASKLVKDNEMAIRNLRRQMQQTAEDAKNIKLPVTGSKTRPDLSTAGKKDKNKDDDKIRENATSYADLAHNIEVYQKRIDAANPAQTQQIKTWTESINKAKAAQQAIRDMQAAYGQPAKLESLADYDAEITRQEGLLKRATADERSGIAAVIKDLKAKRDEIERSSLTEPVLDEITTYQKLEDAISYYQDALKRADDTTRPAIAAQVKQLEEMRDLWQENDELARKPAEEGKLKTLKDIDAAIQYYSQLMQRQTAAEISGTQAIIEGLQKKRQLLTDIAGIAAGGTELGELTALTGKELTIRLKAIGIEGIRAKIRGLQQLLRANNLSGGQRKEIQQQIRQWGLYEKQVRKSQVTFRKSWGTVRQLGTGIKALTSTIKGNGNAWEKTTGIVDAGVEIFEAVSAIINIVRALTATATAEQEAQAITQSATTSATAATYSGLAAAKTAAAYADIPFAGPGLAAAATAQYQAMIIAAAIPKFAAGGVAYGPTLGLFGEYANAARNPEVVAPLDKLRAIISDGHGEGKTDVLFRMRGRDLVGVAKQRGNLTKRS